MNTTFDSETNEIKIMSMELSNQFSQRLENNETVILPYTLSLENPADNRVMFLLFNETVPGPQVSCSDRINSGYRELYLQVSVGRKFFQGDNSGNS
jgi:hypothetical protein